MKFVIAAKRIEWEIFCNKGEELSGWGGEMTKNDAEHHKRGITPSIYGQVT